MTSARDVQIRDNRFIGTHGRVPGNTGASYRIDPRAVVWMARCTGVTLSGNVVESPGPHGRHVLGFGPGMGEVLGASDGIRIEKKRTR